jgi:hypothetical protein
VRPGCVVVNSSRMAARRTSGEADIGIVGRAERKEAPSRLPRFVITTKSTRSSPRQWRKWQRCEKKHFAQRTTTKVGKIGL